MSSTADSDLCNGKFCDLNGPVSCDENSVASDQSVTVDIHGTEGFAKNSVGDSVCFHTVTGLPKNQHIMAPGTTCEQHAEQRIRMMMMLGRVEVTIAVMVNIIVMINTALMTATVIQTETVL